MQQFECGDPKGDSGKSRVVTKSKCQIWEKERPVVLPSLLLPIAPLILWGDFAVRGGFYEMSIILSKITCIL
jgi:hypothetical protein